MSRDLPDIAIQMGFNMFQWSLKKQTNPWQGLGQGRQGSCVGIPPGPTRWQRSSSLEDWKTMTCAVAAAGWFTLVHPSAEVAKFSMAPVAKVLEDSC